VGLGVPVESMSSCVSLLVVLYKSASVALVSVAFESVALESVALVSAVNFEIAMSISVSFLP
jgi:hypothetical protein